MPSDEIFANSMVGNSQVNNVLAQDSAVPDTVSDAVPSFDFAVSAMPADEFEGLASPNGDIADAPIPLVSAIAGAKMGRSSQPAQIGFIEYQSTINSTDSDSTFAWVEDGSWLNLGTPLDMTAVNIDVGAASAVSGAGVGLAANDLLNSLASVEPMTAGNEVADLAHLPDIAAPEPGTCALMALGVSVLAAHFRARRK
jgi:hypothetical protein